MPEGEVRAAESAESLPEYDVVVVGSGFGGSVAALRLSEKGYRVLVLEAGRRFTRETLPRNSWAVKDYLWAPRLGLFGIQRIHVLGKRRLLLAMSVVSALGSRWTARLFLLAFVGGKCRTPFAYRIHSLSLSESRYILLGHLLA